MLYCVSHRKAVEMTNDIQNITRSPLGRKEAQFIAKIGILTTFSIADARRVLGHKKSDPTRQFLERLQTKGWIKRIRRGRFAIIPISSGEDRTPQLHEFIIAMELVSPAAIAYWSAFNHHGMTTASRNRICGNQPSCAATSRRGIGR